MGARPTLAAYWLWRLRVGAEPCFVKKRVVERKLDQTLE